MSQNIYLKELDTEELKNIYNLYMVVDFPADELKPLERITSTMSEGICKAIGLYEADTLKGYGIFILPVSDSNHLQITANCGLLDYFAIISQYRSQGLGHIFFHLIKDFFSCNYPSITGFFIECEDTAAATNPEELHTRNRRISFYTNNDCYQLPLHSNLFGVEYIILFFQTKTAPNLASFPKEQSYSQLDAVYKLMFQKKHYESKVSIW